MVIGDRSQKENEQKIQYNERRALTIPVQCLVFSRLLGTFVFSPKDWKPSLRLRPSSTHRTSKERPGPSPTIYPFPIPSAIRCWTGVGGIPSEGNLSPDQKNVRLPNQQLFILLTIWQPNQSCFVLFFFFLQQFLFSDQLTAVGERCFSLKATSTLLICVS